MVHFIAFRFSLILTLLLLYFLLILSFQSLLLYSAFWRQAGMSYLEYLGVASGAVRQCLKEPARSKAAARGFYSYNKTTGPAGSMEKVPVHSA